MDLDNFILLFFISDHKFAVEQWSKGLCSGQTVFVVAFAIVGSDAVLFSVAVFFSHAVFSLVDPVWRARRLLKVWLLSTWVEETIGPRWKIEREFW